MVNNNEKRIAKKYPLPLFFPIFGYPTPNIMKKILLLLALGVIGFANAQKKGSSLLYDARDSYTPPQMKNMTNPLVLIDGIIGSTAFIEKESQEIESISVYKSAENLPGRLQPFADMVKSGIIDIKTKEGKTKNYAQTIVLADLNKKFGLPENQPLYIDHLKIAATQSAIFADMLKDISVKDENGEKCLLIYSTPKLNSEIKL